MPNLYRFPVTIHATAYVVAKTQREAEKRIGAAFKDAALELPNRRNVFGDVTVTGESYHTAMPSVSLSPAMTIAAIDLNGEFAETLD